uniref:Uncharacterized protein n=1 Tax=Lates calcarifer TaxID=8187 RepID=A0A4W6BX78_LATCA
DFLPRKKSCHHHSKAKSFLIQGQLVHLISLPGCKAGMIHIEIKMEVVEAVTFVEALSVNVVGVTYIQYIYTYKQFGTIWESYRNSFLNLAGSVWTCSERR